MLYSCTNTAQTADPIIEYVIVHDTVYITSPEPVTYNIPCKVMCFNENREGPARLVVLLHGGVREQSRHTFFGPTHLDYVQNDEIICNYLQNSGEKSILIAPICHKSNMTSCVQWVDCAQDVKQIIDDYVSCGWVDPTRIYLTGGSDGGRGTWDIAARYSTTFAAIMPMSCGPNNIILPMPVYWQSTRSEGDFTDFANNMNTHGANIDYKYHGDAGHGMDCNRIDNQLLDRFFSHHRKEE